MITTIINYCSNDFRFLPYSALEAKKFSHEVIVPVCDHFFDGSEENRALLDATYQSLPDCKFVEFAFDEKAYGLYPKVSKGDPNWIHYWHSTARYVGYHYVDPNSDYILFLDADEIADGDRFVKWLESGEYKECDAIRFACYFYFREASWQADKLMRCGLLAKKSSINPELILDIDERRGLYDSIKGTLMEDARGQDGLPLFHHYSWVKTEGKSV